MRIHALLCWYEEPVPWLIAAVAGAARFCDSLVALDGAYALYPGAARQPRSGPEQAEAIIAAATGAGLDYLIHAPARPWEGCEIEKRTALFRLADVVAEPGDWLYVLDADEHVTSVPSNLRDLLITNPCDAGSIELDVRAAMPPPDTSDERMLAYSRGLPVTATDRTVRRFFRWDPTLRVEGVHWAYVVGPEQCWGEEYERCHETGECASGCVDARLLNGPADWPIPLAPALPIDGFRVDHVSTLRSADNQRHKGAYYMMRDRLGMEPGVTS